MFGPLLQRTVLPAVAALLIGGAGILASVHAPSASAQVACSDPTMTCPIAYTDGAVYPGASYSYVTTPYTVSYSAPVTSYVAPVTEPSTVYVVAPTTVDSSGEIATTVGPVPDYVSPGGAYCTTGGGEQIWVPSGVTPGSMGC